MPGARADHQALLRHVADRLSAFGPLSCEDRAAIHGLYLDDCTYVRNADLAPALATPAFPQIVTSGLACQMRPHPRRRRQIFGFVLPGDIIGSFWRRPEFSFYRTVALTRVKTVSAAPLLAVGDDDAFAHPTIVQAVRRAEDHTQHLLFNHIVRLGERDAYSGLAHLLLELHHRLAQVGMAQGGELRLPFSQRVLAQAMGFSVAHTNHTLQRMAADGLFEMRGELIRLVALDRMAALADFSADVAVFETQQAAGWDSRSESGLPMEHRPRENLKHQPDVDGDDGGGQGIAAHLHGGAIGERPHQAPIAGEHHQRHDREAKL
jgi:CRP-like cAMP-binding protein